MTESIYLLWKEHTYVAQCQCWIESNRIMCYRCKWYQNMRYWHTHTQGSNLVSVCSTVSWKDFEPKLYGFAFPNKVKMLVDTGQFWDATGFSGPILWSERGTSFTAGQKLPAHGCLGCGSTSLFLAVVVSPCIWLAFSVWRTYHLHSFAFFVVSFHWGWGGHVLRWALKHFHKPQAFLCG